MVGMKYSRTQIPLFNTRETSLRRKRRRERRKRGWGEEGGRQEGGEGEERGERLEK